jgi:hypothetical protein
VTGAVIGWIAVGALALVSNRQAQSLTALSGFDMATRFNSRVISSLNAELSFVRRWAALADGRACYREPTVVR